MCQNVLIQTQEIASIVKRERNLSVTSEKSKCNNNPVFCFYITAGILICFNGYEQDSVGNFLYAFKILIFLKAIHKACKNSKIQPSLLLRVTKTMLDNLCLRKVSARSTMTKLNFCKNCQELFHLGV